MIEINLLPEEMRKKEPRFKKIDFSGFNMSEIKMQNVPVKRIAIIAALVLVSFHAILLGIGVYSISSGRSSSAQYRSILSQKNEYDSLKSRLDLINRKVGTIDELMVKRFSWAKKLNALSDSMTPGIWLSNLSYEEKLGEKISGSKSQQSSDKKGSKKGASDKKVFKYMVLSGYASSMGEEGTALIGKFIKSLKDNPDFYSDFIDIELGVIRSDRVTNQEVMSFKITCLFKVAE